MIRKLILASAALAVLSGSALANDDIATRKALMKNVGGAVKIGVGTMKGEIPYDAQKAELLLKVMQSSALGISAYFPKGSETGDKTTAAPAIWEDEAGFKAALVKFNGDITAAVDAKPADAGAFKAVFGKVLGNCKSCHEKFRIKK